MCRDGPRSGCVSTIVVTRRPRDKSPGQEQVLIIMLADEYG